VKNWVVLWGQRVVSTVQSLNLQLQVANLQVVFHSSQQQGPMPRSVFMNSLGDGLECPFKSAEDHRPGGGVGIPVGGGAWQKLHEVQQSLALGTEG